MASGTALLRDKFHVATIKLTFFYVLSTSVILIVSSVAILVIFTPPEIEMRPLFSDERDDIEHSEWSLDELREHLAGVIVVVDISVLLIVSVLSYYFARRTLLPIKQTYELQHQFMSDVAHELRTPLAVMQAGADTILRKQRSLGEYEVFVRDTQEEVGRMTRLSNQLLQLLLTDRVHSVVRVPTNVSHLIEAQVRHFTPYADAHGVTITCDIAPNVTLYTEQDSVVEVIQNVLKNGIDYNKRPGAIVVTLSETDVQVTVSIQDTGVGITAATQTTVFDRFVKGDAARTQTTRSGAGLGLSIVKALMVRLGGTIALTSTPMVGTTVTITLPKAHS